MAFTKATKQQAKLRMAIHGPSGSGKTMSALLIGAGLVPGGRVALIDTERGSASKYADRVDFDTDTIADNYHPDRLIAALREAAGAGYDVVIVDSLSLFWNGPGGLLELVEAETTRAKAKNGRADSFAAWKVVDPIYRRMVQAILACPAHVITTMRAKQEFVKEEENGRTKIRKVGMAPEMRDAFQYEADVEGMLDMEHNFIVGKTRCEAIDGKVFAKPGKDLGDILRAWLTDGAPATERAAEPVRVAIADHADAKHFDHIKALLLEATTSDALSVAREELQRAVKAKKLTVEQRAELVVIGQQRKADIEAAQAPATEFAEVANG